MITVLNDIERKGIEEILEEYFEEDAFYEGSCQIHTLSHLDSLIKDLKTISKDIHLRENEKQKLAIEISENLENILKKYEFKGDVCELLDYVADDIRKNYY